MRPVSQRRLRLALLVGLAVGVGCAPEVPASDAPQAAVETASPAASRPAAVLVAQAPRFRHLTIADGLSQNAANALLQDRRGFVWIGTQDGLDRYDGAAFVVYRHDPFDPATLSSSYVTALAEDADGRIWVGTLAGGLNRLDPETGAVVRYANSPASAIRALAQDRRGDLWVGTNGSGAYRLARADLDRPDAPFESFRPTPGDGRSLSSDRVEDILVDRRGDVWLTASAGLDRLDDSGRGFVHIPSPPALADRLDPAVLSLTEAADGTIWAGTYGGLLHIVPNPRGEVAFFPHGHPEGPLGVWDLVASPAGALWLATSGGLARFDPATGRYTFFRHDSSDPQSLAGDRLSSILWDRSDVVWAGTNGFGLDRYDWKGAHFETIRRPVGLAAPADGFSVRSLLEAADGTLWISAKVLYRYDRATGTLALADVARMGLPGLAGEEVPSMLQDRQGVLWFAARGLHRYDPATGAARSYTYDAARPNGLTREYAFGVFEDRQGAIWALTPHHVSRLDDAEAGRFTHVRYAPDGLEINVVASVHEDARGRFWIATDAGLVRLDVATGEVRRYRMDPGDPTSLSQNLVRSILPDPVEPDRVLWIGTAGGGLNRLDLETETFTHVTTREGLPNDVVYGILPDAEGRLWLSTNRGLARYDPRTGDVRAFDARDGLQSDEFNTGAFTRGASGRFYFGGIYGVNAFDPEAVAGNAHVPPIVLTGLRIGDRTVAVGDSTGLLDRALWATDGLRLSHRENMVTFSFAALDYSAPEKNRYAYRMEGFDDDWIQAGTSRTATYTNLPAGRYTFRVRGSNNDGVWNEAGAALAVTVEPPWWRAWWALLLYASLLVVAVGAVVRVREERQRLAQRVEAERVEADALRELDRAKSAFFANVSHEFRTPLTLTLGPLDDLLAGEYGTLPTPLASQVGLARRNAGRVLGLVNQILEVARLEAGQAPLRARPVDLGAFVDAVAQPFRPEAERRAVRFHVDAPAAPVEVFSDPAQLETALSNLLSNALKFTPEGGTVRVGVEADAEAARVTVRDSGPGIPAADLPHVFDRFYQVDESAQTRLGTGIGLALAKEIADLHGGRLVAESEEGFGSTFTLSLPLGRAHLAPDQVDDRAWDGAVSARPESVETDPASDAESNEDDATTVLVADDHADIRAYLRRHLEAAGYRVAEAADGEAALASVRQRLPDLVVSDVMMPRLDGLGLCRALRADPETDFVPVLLLTAKAAPEDRIDGLAELCDDYLTKPFDARELVARVDNLIALRQRLRTRFAGSGASGDGSSREVEVASTDDAFVATLRATIAERLGDEAFDVGALAEALGQSRSSLLRRTTALLDASPSDLLRAARLNRAAELLDADAGSVGEIAYGVGFKSVAHFSNAFLAHHGVRPSSYTEAPR